MSHVRHTHKDTHMPDAYVPQTTQIPSQCNIKLQVCSEIHRLFVLTTQRRTVLYKGKTPLSNVSYICMSVEATKKGIELEKKNK
jgi:hypothetical protein